MARYGMVIDLQNCVGCGACALACKAENNTDDRHDGQSYNWADFLLETTGTFPKVTFEAIPVLCNHCSKAPCVEACPVEPKAMYKTPEGITMHNDERCIGCQSCQDACPYSVLDLEASKAQYSVIHFNAEDTDTYPRWRDESVLIAGCTASAAATGQKVGSTLPFATDWHHPDVEAARRPGVTEKCTFCAHRLAEGLSPACVETCPAEARIFGDLDDPSSAPRKALASQESFRLKEETGTEPNVFYIRKYSVS